MTPQRTRLVGFASVALLVAPSIPAHRAPTPSSVIARGFPHPSPLALVPRRAEGSGAAPTLDVTVRVFPGVGHSLVLMTPDGPRYPPDYLDYLAQWARQRISN